MSLHDRIYGKQVQPGDRLPKRLTDREAYDAGAQDGATLALFTSSPGEPHTVFGRRMYVTVTWIDEAPPPRYIAGAVEQAQQRQQERLG